MQTIKQADHMPIIGQYYFSVLEFIKVTTPGDERWERTGGGHGYGPETNTYTQLHIFEDQAELERWIAGPQSGRNPYIVLHTKRLGVKVRPVIEFE